MITRIIEKPIFEETTYSSIRIESLINTYGFEQEFISFYQMDCGSIFVLYDGVLTLYAKNSCNYEELVVFVKMHHSVQTIFSDKDTIKIINNYVNGELINITLLKKSSGFDNNMAEDITPKDTYPILKEVFNEGVLPFDIWYADAFYRYSKGFMHIKGVREQGKLVSCALTVAETNHSWIIGGVATIPFYRHNGYARKCIESLGSINNVDIYISPKNDYAKTMYLKMGFIPYEECASLKIY